MRPAPRKLISEHELKMIVLHAFLAGVSNGNKIANVSVDDMVRATAQNMAAIAICDELDITDEIDRMYRAKYRAAA